MGEIEIKRHEGGAEYIQLDAFCAAYNRSRENLSKCILVTETSTRLPMIGYLFPNLFGEKYPPQNASQSKRKRAHITGFVPALQVAIKGSTIGDDYVVGATVSYSVGLLCRSAINGWNTCVSVLEPWTVNVWEKAGFDFRLFLRQYWFLRDISLGKKEPLAYSLETMRIGDPIDLEALSNVHVQRLCDLLRIDAQGAPALSQALRARINLIDSEQLRRTSSMGKTKVFTEIKNITEQLPRRLKRLIAVAMLFEFWEANTSKYISRADNLVQLGIAENPNETTLWNDCVECGRVAPSRSMVFKKFQAIQNQAQFFFNKCPQEFIRLRDEIELEREFYQKEIADGDREDPLLRWGTRIDLPPGQRRNRAWP